MTCFAELNKLMRGQQIILHSLIDASTNFQILATSRSRLLQGNMVAHTVCLASNHYTIQLIFATVCKNGNLWPN
jgi:hypothetical protein